MAGLWNARHVRVCATASPSPARFTEMEAAVYFRKQGLMVDRASSTPRLRKVEEDTPRASLLFYTLGIQETGYLNGLGRSNELDDTKQNLIRMRHVVLCKVRVTVACTPPGASEVSPPVCTRLGHHYGMQCKRISVANLGL